MNTISSTPYAARRAHLRHGGRRLLPHGPINHHHRGRGHRWSRVLWLLLAVRRRQGRSGGRPLNDFVDCLLSLAATFELIYFCFNLFFFIVVTALFLALETIQILTFLFQILFECSLHAQKQGVSPLPRVSMLADLQFTETCVWVLQFGVGMDGKKLEPESNVLLASIENMQYAVNLDVLHMFSLLLGLSKRLQCLTRMVVYCARFNTRKKRIDERENLTLDHIQRSLVRQEDSIIFYLLERAQYCYNVDTYEPNAFSMDGFHGSLVEYMLKETGKLHAKV
ncbi:hypothetical protein K1719_026590 [Acacia pycnantha]|nr:hypothetical protein K1719_026590 [Acacia pycnantha]